MAVIKSYPGSKKVHEDEREFARLVGECITTWAFVDREVFRLFRLHLETTSKRTAVVYYRWPTLAGRADLTDALLKAELSKSCFRKKVATNLQGFKGLAWDTCRDRTSTGIARRNRQGELADFLVLDTG